MKTHFRAVVIGGGVVGVSTLYHLTKKGWTDVALLERTELTAGSTWHAAGLLPLFNMSYTVGQLHKYSVDLYKRLPKETGQDVSFHVTGNLRLATCKERMDEYQKYCGTANTIGVPFEVISPAQVKELWPLAEIGGTADTPAIIGALYHPDDGHIAPADLTMALRKGARSAGAEIYEQTEVLGVERTQTGEWKIRTNKGDVTAEHIVCATGNYARQTGRMFGLNVPAIPVEHQYIVYDESPELKAYRQGGGRELAVLRESDKSYYLREERMGWILGPYEKGAPARFADGVPDWFGRSLFEGDLDRLLPHVEAAQRRVPSLENCGIKDIVNGPISYTPDGSPLIGPARRLVAPAGNSPSGSSRASPASICWRSIRVGMATTRANATSSKRTKKRIATSSSSTSRTRSVPTPAPRRRARCTTRSTAWAPCGASVMVGSAPTGLRHRESSARIAGASVARTTSSTWAMSAVACASRLG
jgi:dimethylglycine dehydrogenase